MPPTEQGIGQLFHSECYLCDVLYSVDYPLSFANVFSVMHLTLTVKEYDASSLLALSNLVLLTADGTKHPLPQSLELQNDGQIHCTVNLTS